LKRITVIDQSLTACARDLMGLARENAKFTTTDSDIEFAPTKLRESASRITTDKVSAKADPVRD
jgi:hypothetical protein